MNLEKRYKFSEGSILFPSCRDLEMQSWQSTGFGGFHILKKEIKKSLKTCFSVKKQT